MSPLNRLRLRNQWLFGSTTRTPLEVVTHFGAVQSQELAPAMWALGLRAKGLAQADVVRAYDAGEILRTHVLRPTWHFVAADDLRWMLGLSAPRLWPAARAQQAKIGVTRDIVARSRRTIERALRDEGPLTRTELVERMRRDGLPLEGQQGYHLTFDAELECLICSGPLRGKHVTFDLLDRRVPAAEPIERDQALETLTRRYFTSHGPATERDCAWWSGLTLGDVRRAISILGADLESVEYEGIRYVVAPSRMPPAPRGPLAHLLPCFDELTVAYAKRGAVAGPDAPKGEPPGAFLTDLVVIDGVRVGTWKRVARGPEPVTLALGRRLSAAEKSAVDKAVGSYRRFVGRE
jgi:hypothetical protein